MTTLTRALGIQASNMCAFGFEDTTPMNVLADWRAWHEGSEVDHPRFYFSVRAFEAALHIYGGPDSVDPYADDPSV